MEFVYVFLHGCEWEDVVIFLSKEEAIEESIRHPNNRIEIFSKTNTGYIPTYNYYKNEEFFQNS
jgi:hypothetical protein